MPFLYNTSSLISTPQQFDPNIVNQILIIKSGLLQIKKTYEILQKVKFRRSYF